MDGNGGVLKGVACAWDPAGWAVLGPSAQRRLASRSEERFELMPGARLLPNSPELGFALREAKTERGARVGFAGA